MTAHDLSSAQLHKIIPFIEKDLYSKRLQAASHELGQGKVITDGVRMDFVPTFPS